MVKLTIEEWQQQSSLLLQARPTTTRITTKYNIPNLDSAKYQKSKKRKRDTEVEEKDASTAGAAPKVPRAVLTLKTFDPESGVVLKVKTDRAADVGRLINGLGRLARHMAALPERTEDVVMRDEPVATKEDHPESTSASHPTAANADKPAQQTSGKKKKKGKK